MKRKGCSFTLVMNATRKQVEAQYLKKGDKLASGGVVTHAPTSGLNTPSGKVDIGIDGFKRTWNKKTLIAVVVESL